MDKSSAPVKIASNCERHAQTGPNRHSVRVAPTSSFALSGGVSPLSPHHSPLPHLHYMRAMSHQMRAMVLLPGATGGAGRGRDSRSMHSRGRLRNASTARWSAEPALVMAVISARVEGSQICSRGPACSPSAEGNVTQHSGDKQHPPVDLGGVLPHGPVRGHTFRAAACAARMACSSSSRSRSSTSRAR